MLRYLLICVLLVFASFSSSPRGAEAKDSYFEGALKIYSQFKEPSRLESEKFFEFVRIKWEQGSCSNNCTEQGKRAGMEYANLKKVELDGDY
ncbi:lysis inhibition [Pseudomonas phage PspYZU05]|uniref:Lysis inhibition regulator n=1 Tax=Pseudomonas phage PspYZU05 TaxID=1983556 RepID=A0A2U7NBW4_9CAUD|nr:lysis inhibition [Pseudomonas phage PspYZU05]ASD52119.1 lysis inhibition regulator [Pseudomonas phage PspYZU05]